MDNGKIKTILDELYKIDNSFANNEKDLVKIIAKLLANKPKVRIDNGFLKKVRSELLETATGEKQKNLIINPERLFNGVGIIFNYMRKLPYIYGAAAAIAVVALVLIYGLYPNEQGLLNRPGPIAYAPGQIKKLSDNAFGKLSGQAQGAGAQAESAANSTVKGLGGGGGSPATSATANSYAKMQSGQETAPTAITDSAARTQSGGGGDVASIMPYPGPMVYKYVYKGKELSLNEEKREVYKKNTDLNLGQNLTSLIGGIKFDLVDLKKFPGVVLRNFNLTQKEELGYDISVDLDAGFISIYNNDRGWYDYGDVQPMVKCLAPGCGGGSPLDISDVPSDEALLKMANDFINDKGINISGYGKPRVEDYWRRDYILMKEQGYAYIPDVINVIYPLMINGSEAKDMGGSDYGLRVNVNIRKNKVAGLYGLGIYNFESSMYEAETDAAKILKIAEQGGYGYYYYPEGAEIVEVEIGEPELVYASYFQYSDGRYSEIFVPALSFPILSQPDTPYYYRNNIVVPLIKDLLEDENVIPEPMPLIEPTPLDFIDGSGEGSAPAGEPGTVGGALPQSGETGTAGE